MNVLIIRVLRRKKHLPEGLNLIYSLYLDKVSDLVCNLESWPEGTQKYFEKDLKRLPFQINHEMLIRLHTIKLLKNKNVSN